MMAVVEWVRRHVTREERARRFREDAEAVERELRDLRERQNNAAEHAIRALRESVRITEQSVREVGRDG